MAGRRALVTGAGGFVGQWLCRALVRDGWDVTGSSLVGAPASGILSPEDHALVHWRRDDLLDASTVGAAVEASAPDAVFHLAGVAFVPAAVIARELNLRMIETICVASYDYKKQGELQIIKPVSDNIVKQGAKDGSGLLIGDDLVDTGNTLRANGLEPQELIAMISSRLVVNQAAMKLKHDRLQPLLQAFRSATR